MWRSWMIVVIVGMFQVQEKQEKKALAAELAQVQWDFKSGTNSGMLCDEHWSKAPSIVIDS